MQPQKLPEVRHLVSQEPGKLQFAPQMVDPNTTVVGCVENLNPGRKLWEAGKSGPPLALTAVGTRKQSGRLVFLPSPGQRSRFLSSRVSASTDYDRRAEWRQTSGGRSYSSWAHQFPVGTPCGSAGVVQTQPVIQWAFKHLLSFICLLVCFQQQRPQPTRTETRAGPPPPLLPLLLLS